MDTLHWRWMEEKLDGNYTRMLRAILNKSWRQHPTKQQLYSNLPPIMKTIQVRWTRHAGHCWRSRYELISDVLIWTPSHGRAKAGRPARTYIQQLCEDTGCSPGDILKAMNDKEGWWERIRNIRADGTTRWWWWQRTEKLILLIIKKYIYQLALLQSNGIFFPKWEESLLMQNKETVFTQLLCYR